MLHTIKLLIIALFFTLSLHAQTLTMENITLHLQKGIQTKLKGQNKPIVQNIYAKTGNKPLWVGSQNSKKMSALIQALKDPLFNYKNHRFDQVAIKKLLYHLDNNEIKPSQQAAVYARLDLMLTNSFVRLVRFIVQGDVDWALVQEKLAMLKKQEDIHLDWEIRPKAFPNQNAMIAAIRSGNIHAYLETLLPMEKHYRSLVTLLKNYRVMDKFPKIKYQKNPLKLGDSSSTVREIKKRLQITGDYPKNAPIDRNFDATLLKAVKTYQKRYLLKVDGRVDKTMTYYLNQPVKKNIQAIITNLDKTKIYPRSFENEYVEVNIPDFNLRYYKNQVLMLKMGIVVGRMDRPTPLFSDKIEYMVVNPTWTVTDNLVKRDLIPVLESQPTYLEDHDIHVFSGNKEVKVTYDMLKQYIGSKKPVPYRFVQYPGDNNALGRIKFMFPNKYAVYLHDTDNKSLLDRRYKLYSSGCVRVDRPFELMDLLLMNARKKYTHEDIEKIIATNKPHTIRLKKAIPVHMVYKTVFVEDGLAYFKYDIYLLDQIVQESVAGNKKQTFSIPKNRMISVQKNAQPMSN